MIAPLRTHIEVTDHGGDCPLNHTLQNRTDVEHMHMYVPLWVRNPGTLVAGNSPLLAGKGCIECVCHVQLI